MNKAVILAGGKGTRLYPVTKEIPKPLLPVKRKPIINHLIDLFKQYDISDIAVLANKDFEEDFIWWKKRYYPSARSSTEVHSKSSGQVPNIKLVVEEEPLGTFGGLHLLKEWIGNDSFFLTNGDELKSIDLNKMNDFHKRLNVPATIALVEVPDPSNYGVVICNNEKIEKFLEKPKDPPSKYISSGLYLLNPEIFNYLPCQDKVGHQGLKFSMIETDVFPKLVEEGKLAGFKFDGAWTDCGTWERYEKAVSSWQD